MRDRVLLASNFAFSSLPFRLRGYPTLRFDQLDALSDSPIRLWPSSTAAARSFDFATAPIPQVTGARIVFTSSRDGFMQIYTMNSDGTGQTRLTSDGSNNENPRWSADGAKVLFQSDRDSPGSGLRDIYVMNADGSGQFRLTTDTNDDCNATWSADGSKIVFQSFRNSLSYQVYAMNADGSGQVNISNSASNDTQPSWSSDSAKIVFASDRDQPGFPSIYVMNSNGSNQIRLTWSSTGCWDEQPIWSPDRTKILFTSTRDSATETWQETDDDGNIITKSKLKINKEVYVMTASGISQTRLTNDLSNDDSACWSTDGTKIVFRSERERVEFDPIPQIWTMNSDGTNQTSLSNSGDGDFSPSWSSSYNQSPVANAGGPYNGIISQPVSFNAGGSFDPDGTVTGYSWTFGDGSSGSGASPAHSYASAGTYAATVTITDNFGATNSATANVSVYASVADQYTQNFYQWALLRSPNAEETNYWTAMFRAAYAHGQGSMTLAMREMGKTIFESAEYAARNRSDHWYVYDLYKSYLMREPDAQGWANWEATVPIYGREQVRRGFDESTEFQNLVATIAPTGSPSAAVSSLATARVDPFNQSGNQLQARDAEWGVNLISLPGRAGLDLGLGLSYSSSVWTHSGPYNYFDEENGSPSPGFKIGFPTVQEKYFDAQVGANVYLLTTAAGRKVELRQVGTSNVYESADSSYLKLTYSGNLVVRTTDGTQMTFGWTGINEYRCIEIKDRNGNHIVVNYDWRGDIQNVTDTLGRVITFNYDANTNLSSITQTWNGQTPPHTWASFGWENLTMQPTLAGVVGTHSGETIPVLKMVGFGDGTYTKFLYNTHGQVSRITQYASDSNPATDNHSRNYTAFDYDSATNDCPRLTATRTWAEYWTGLNGVPTEVTTYLGVEGDSRVMTAPDGTVYKETYAGSADAAWMRGLTKSSEVWSAGVQQKLSTIGWTQDNTGTSYKVNPRVTETNVYDSIGNRRRVTIDYSVATYVQYGLPYFVTEYAADGLTEIRRTYTDYNLSQSYLDRRIIGLPAAVHLTDGSGYQAKITYSYDDPERITSQATTATLHDQSYDASFTVRGNVTSVSRWDVTDINNASKALTTFMSYNAAGSVVSTTDPAGHTNSMSYADSFSDGNNSRNTFAYPTAATDADQFSSVIQYNYDFGAKTRFEGPPPQNQPNGIIETFAYDAAARIQQVTTLNNSAYTRYVYGPFWVQSFSTVNNIADEAYAITVFDGVGRAFGTVNNHPGSIGEYRLLNTIFDRMGRAVQQSNPTEVDNSWIPAGDDAYNPVTGEGGTRYTQQTYDWKGRPRITTNTDGTTKEATYSACGCAGSEIATLTDEGTTVNGETKHRQQKMYSDVFGRTWKTEILDWDSSVYSATTSTFNARDQVTLLRQWAGAENGGGPYQETTMTYDGYGRLHSKHVPEQNAGTTTTWSYNLDDTVNSVTDARGASATYIYNNGRRLVNGISYSAPSGITPTSNVSFGYDAAGNRTSMTDGLGTVSYGYNQLSQMTSERRDFADPSVSYLNASFTLSYDYNLAGELKTITDPWGATLNYNFDSSGRFNSINSSGYGSVSQFLSNQQYRAWGTLKSETYGNGFTENATYNNRLQMTSFQLTAPDNQPRMSRTYQYYPDAQLKFSHDAIDERFDRAFAYDHSARVTDAMTGSQARDFINGTTSGAPTGPYGQSYQFNAFSQITQQTNRLWNDNRTATSTYENNRMQGWSYDAAGFVTNGDGTSFFRDAAGRNFHTNGGGTDRWYQFDGDGRMLKQAASKNGNVTSVTYNLNSSVLGGLAVAELNSSGQKTKRYIYAGRRKLAQEADGTVTWSHEEPVSGSRGDSTATGLYIPKAEFNADGVDVGFAAPQPDESPEPITDWPRSGLGSSGGSQCSGANPNCINCYIDGFEQNCARVRQLGEAGILRLQVRNRQGQTRFVDFEVIGGMIFIPGKPHVRQGERIVPGFEPSTEDPNSPLVWNPNKVVLYSYITDGGGEWIPIPEIRTVPIQNLRDNVQRLLRWKNPKEKISCGEAIQKMISTAAEMFPQMNGQNSKTFMEAFDRIAGQRGYVADIPPSMYWAGGTVGGDAFASLDPKHGAKPAIVYLHPFQYYDVLTERINAQAQLHYAFSALHETFHRAARGAYDDTEMAQVVSKITGWPLPPKGSDVTTYSGFWEAYLSSHCRPAYLSDAK